MHEILEAAEQGNDQKLEELLKKEKALVRERSKDGDQPLHLAAWQGHLQTIEILLRHGADINAPGDGQRTPLHYAVEEATPKVVKFLLEKGADPNIVDEFGHAPIYWAAAGGAKSLAKVFLKYGAKKDLDVSIYLDGATKVLKALKADPNAFQQVKDKTGFLIEAIRSGDVELVRFVVEHGTDVNKKSRNNLPLYQALEGGSGQGANIAIVKILLENGADVTEMDHVGRPILEFCEIYRVSPDVRKLLIKHGAN